MRRPSDLPPVRSAPAPRNGLRLAAVVVAPVGILFGLIPLTGFIAVIYALVAVPLALVARSRSQRGLATNGKTAATGLVLGLVALALGVWGISIVFNTVDQLAGPSPVSSGATGGGNGPALGQASDTPSAAAGFGQRRR